MTSKFKLLSAVAASVLLCAGVASAQSNSETHKTQQESSSHANGATQKQSRGDRADKSSPNGQVTKESKSEEKSQKAGAKTGAEKSSTTGQASRERGGKSSAQNATNERGKKAGAEHDRMTGTTGQAASSENKSKNAAENQSGGKSHENGKNQNAAGKKSSTTGQASETTPSSKSSTKGQTTEKSNTGGQANERTPNNSVGQTNQTNENQAQSSQPNSSGQTAANRQQASAQVKGAKLDPQQVTKVQQAVLSTNNAPRVKSVNFSIDVGTRVPSHVHVVAVPQTLVEIYPEWRNDEYFVTQDEIVIVNHSHEIVAVIPAESHRASVGSSTSEEIDISQLSEPEIREIQMVLIRRGYLHGRADGVFGSETRDALITFQRKEGLQASGKLDRRTVTSLGLSGKINAGAGGASATTGEGPSNNASQGQTNNAAQGRQNNAPQAQQSRGQNKPSEQKNTPQAQSQAPETRQSTTGQGGQSRSPNAQQPAGSGNQSQ